VSVVTVVKVETDNADSRKETDFGEPMPLFSTWKRVEHAKFHYFWEFTA